MDSILNYGGIGDGVTPNDGAFATWLSLLPSYGGALTFPAGTYLFSNPIAITLAAARACITLEGDGSNLSNLVWATPNGGISITAAGSYNSVHIRGLSILTGVAGGAGCALSLNSTFWNLGNWSTIDDVTIRGKDGPGGTEYWDHAAIFTGWGNINSRSLNTNGSKGNGVGIVARGQTSPLMYAVLFNFDSCSFNDHSYGLIYGSYVQGLTLNQCNFNGESGIAGLATMVGAEGVLSLLSITGSQFDYGGPAILLQTAIDSVQLANNTFTITRNGFSAVNLEGVFQFNSIGNYYNVNTNTNPNPSGMFGLVVGPPGFGTSNGDCFKDINCPINLKAGTSNIVIGANRYYPTCGPIIDSGAGNIWLAVP